MEKITGIKSVDFKITAYGHGVVNWNGSTEVNAFIKNKWRTISNHNMPKLRGYTKKQVLDGSGEKKWVPKSADEIDFKKNYLYISQNCIRYHLFKDDVINWQHPDIHNNVDRILCSMTGLVRGYVIPQNENKRTSALLITDFKELQGNGNYEQMGRSGSKEKQTTKSGAEKSTSMFSKTTFGDTHYEAYGSISIEQLQFISLSENFGREAMKINNHKEGQDLAKKIEEFIKQLDFSNDQISATYHKNYVRRGTIFSDGEAGILLNDAAIDALVTQVLGMIKNLGFRQGKGYMIVDKVEIDYNSSDSAKDMLRIKSDSNKAIPQKQTMPYAIYFEGRELL